MRIQVGNIALLIGQDWCPQYDTLMYIPMHVAILAHGRTMLAFVLSPVLPQNAMHSWKFGKLL